MLKNSLPLGGHRMWLVPLLGYSSSSFSFTLDSVCDSLCLHFPMISERTFSWVQLSGRFPIAFFPSAKAIYILSVLQRSHIFPPALYGIALAEGKNAIGNLPDKCTQLNVRSEIMGKCRHRLSQTLSRVKEQVEDG